MQTTATLASSAQRSGGAPARVLQSGRKAVQHPLCFFTGSAAQPEEPLTRPNAAPNPDESG
jgi:hypothetical protein